MKVKLNNDQLMGIINSIDAFLQGDDTECFNAIYIDVDLLCLVRATLEELQLKLRQMALVGNKKYSFKLKPTWAFVLRTVFAGRSDVTTLEGITMMRICDDVHREYALLINN